jgi:ABC-type transport system involved in multi-copper enzyme maturation permease subunit
MLKAEGLTLIKILAVILAVWTASVSIADEIEGRTALTLLSKPVGRRQLILGKFLGVIAPVAILFILLGALFLGTVSYKVVYDARESSSPPPESAQCQAEMIAIVPGLALAFMEAVVLASVAVAISTRLPMLANLTICASIYVLGHLVPLLVNSAVGEFVIVGFVGNFLSAVLPVLDHFSIETAISTGQKVPLIYLAATGAYCVAYCTVAMLLALLLFEDRDLA